MSHWGNTKSREEGGTASRIKLPSHQQQQQQRAVLCCAVSVYVCVRACGQSLCKCAVRETSPVHTASVFWSLTCGSMHRCEKHEKWDPAVQRTSERKVRTNELKPQGEHRYEAFCGLMQHIFAAFSLPNEYQSFECLNAYWILGLGV